MRWNPLPLIFHRVAMDAVKNGGRTKSTYCTCYPRGTLEKSLGLGLEVVKRKERGSKKTELTHEVARKKGFPCIFSVFTFQVKIFSKLFIFIWITKKSFQKVSLSTTLMLSKFQKLVILVILFSIDTDCRKKFNHY